MNRLALFDLDDTLAGCAGTYRRWAEVFASTRELSAADLAVLYDVDLWEVPFSEQLRRIHTHFEVPESAEDFWIAFRDAYPRYVRCEPETLHALKRLRDNGWRIGIVTNGRVDNQHDKITMSGLDRFVDGWVISEAAGITKPDPAIFEAAAAKLGVSLADGGWMVGDNLAADIAGGQAVGLDTVWLHHNRTRADTDPRPTHAAASPAEAVDLILA